MPNPEQGKEPSSSAQETTVVHWDITPNVTTVSMQFSLFNKVKTGGRGTLLRLQSSSLAVFSRICHPPYSRRFDPSQPSHTLSSSILSIVSSSHLGRRKTRCRNHLHGGRSEKREKSEGPRGTEFSHILKQGNHSTEKFLPNLTPSSTTSTSVPTRIKKSSFYINRVVLLSKRPSSRTFPPRSNIQNPLKMQVRHLSQSLQEDFRIREETLCGRRKCCGKWRVRKLGKGLLNP
jgi:hypothetical protein